MTAQGRLTPRSMEANPTDGQRPYAATMRRRARQLLPSGIGLSRSNGTATAPDLQLPMATVASAAMAAPDVAAAASSTGALLSAARASDGERKQCAACSQGFGRGPAVRHMFGVTVEAATGLPAGGAGADARFIRYLFPGAWQVAARMSSTWEHSRTPADASPVMMSASSSWPPWPLYMYLTRFSKRVLCAHKVHHKSHQACCAPVGEEEALYSRDADVGAFAAFHASACHSIALQPGEQLRTVLAPQGSCPADALRFEVGCNRVRVS